MADVDVTSPLYFGAQDVMLPKLLAKFRAFHQNNGWVKRTGFIERVAKHTGPPKSAVNRRQRHYLDLTIIIDKTAKAQSLTAVQSSSYGRNYGEPARATYRIVGSEQMIDDAYKHFRTSRNSGPIGRKVAAYFKDESYLVGLQPN